MVQGPTAAGEGNDGNDFAGDAAMDDPARAIKLVGLDKSASQGGEAAKEEGQKEAEGKQAAAQNR